MQTTILCVQIKCIMQCGEGTLISNDIVATTGPKAQYKSLILGTCAARYSVRPFVCLLSATTRNKAVKKRYQRPHCHWLDFLNGDLRIIVLRSKVMA